MNRHVTLALTCVVLATQVSVGVAQFGRPAGGWYTSSGMNPQRTSSIQRDVWIMPSAMTSGEFRFQWMWKPAGAPHVPSVMAVTMQNGLFKPLSMVAFGPSYYATIDNEIGTEYWTKTVAAPPAKGCESASAIARASDANVPPPAPFVPNGNPGPFASAVGNPGEGAPAEIMVQGATDAYLKAAAEARAAGKPIPPPPPRASRAPAPSALGDAVGAAGGGLAAAPPPGAPGGVPGGAGGARAGVPSAGGTGTPTPNTPAARFAGGGIRFNVPQGFYGVTPDGVLHNFGQNTAKDISQPRPFLPAGSKVSDLIVVGNVAYATVAGGCGGADAGIYSVSTTGPVASATTSSLKIAIPVGGPTFLSNGNMFLVEGKGGEDADSLVAVDAKTLKVKEKFAIPGGAATPATVTKIGDKEFLATAGKDGTVHLVDPALLKAVAMFKAPDGTTKGSPATPLIAWMDEANITRIAEQTEAGTVTMKTEAAAQGPVITAAWSTTAVASSQTPLVVGSVLFGVDHSKTRLVALDGATGKTLWTSGKKITSPINSQPWYSLGQVYVATQDSTVYAFGMPMERY